MPRYQITSPSGQRYEVTAPEGATEQQVLAYVQNQVGAPASQEQAGFGSSFAETFRTGLAAPAAAVFGATDDPEARRALIKKQESDRLRTSFAEVEDLPSFVDWGKQMLGSSLGYLAAPAVLGKIASLAKGTPAGRAVAFGTLGLQYATDYLGRQASEQERAEQAGEEVKPVQVGKALLAAAASTGADALGFKFFTPVFNRFPLLRTVFGEAGEQGAKKTTDDVVEAFTSGKYKFGGGIAQGVAKGMAFEIPQEIFQQVVERWQAGLPLTDEDARREYGEAMAGAAFLGGGLGAISGGMETYSARSQARREVEAKQLKAETEKRLREAEIAEQRKAEKATTLAAKAEENRQLREQKAAELRSQIKDEDIKKAFDALVAHAKGTDTVLSVGAGKAVAEALGLPTTDPRVHGFIKLLEREGYLSPKDETIKGRKILKPFEVKTPSEQKGVSGQEGVVESTVRVYHGGNPESVTGPLWFTSSLNDAKGWASRNPNMKLWYVDIPASMLQGDPANGIAPLSRIELPAEIANQRKLLEEPVVSVKDAVAGVQDLINRDPKEITDPAEIDAVIAAINQKQTAIKAAAQQAFDSGRNAEYFEAQDPSKLLTMYLSQLTRRRAALVSTEETKAAPDVKAAEETKAAPDVKAAEEARLAAEAKAAVDRLNALKKQVHVTQLDEVTDLIDEIESTDSVSEETLQRINALESTVQKPAEGKPWAEKLGKRVQTAVNRLDDLRMFVPESRLVELAALYDKLRTDNKLTAEDAAKIEELQASVPTAPSEGLGQASQELSDVMAKASADIAGTAEEVELTEEQKERGFTEAERRKAPKGMERILYHLAAEREASGQPTPTQALAQMLLDYVSESGLTESQAYTKEELDSLKRRKRTKENPFFSLSEFNKFAGKERSVKAFRPKLIVEGTPEAAEYQNKIDRLRKNGKVASYEPKSNTFVFTKEGMTDKVVLHEIVHAYTVEVMHKYLTGRRKSLTPDQRMGAAQIMLIYNKVKPIYSAKYPTAFEDVYEFIANAMTDSELQQDLLKTDAKITPIYTLEVSESKTPGYKRLRDYVKNVWAAFTRAVATMFGPLTRGLTREQMLGNPMLELSEAISEVMLVPRQQKTEYTGKPLFASSRSRRGGSRSLVSNMPDMTPEEVFNEPTRLDDVAAKKTGLAGAIKFFSTLPGAELLIKRFQDSRRPLKLLQDLMEMSGKLVYTGEGANDLYNKFATAVQKAHWALNSRLQAPMTDINDAAAAYAEAKNISFQQALNILDKLFIAQHEKERRKTLFQKLVPLNQMNSFVFPSNPAMGTDSRTAQGHREFIEKRLAENTRLSTAEINSLRAAMDYLTDPNNGHLDPNGFSPLGEKLTDEMRASPLVLDMNSNLYSPLGKYTPATYEGLRALLAREMADPKLGPILQKLDASLQLIQNRTIELNKQANYWTTPLDNVTEFYGWKHYVPFKGKPEYEPNTATLQLERFTGNTGGGYEFVESQEGFTGRDSDVDNVILQTMVDGSKSAMRVGRIGISQAIKNLIDSKIIAGRKVTKDQPITFQQRFLGLIDPKKNPEFTGPNKIYHYLPDGSIEVYEILARTPKEKDILSSIRKAYSSPSAITDFANRVTSGIGFLHTRYNPSFHIYNFVRDIFSNAFLMGALRAPGLAGDYMTAVADRTAMSLPVAFKLSKMYHSGDIEGMERYAAENPAARDIVRYMKLGGRVAFISGVTTASELDSLNRKMNNSPWQARLDGFNQWVDVWADMFELTSRAAAFSVSKAHYMTAEGGGLSEADAEAKAVADTKNLANFETVGEWGKQAGAFFMFFRPAATGAVVAMDALRPLLVDEQTMINQMPQAIAADPEARAKFIENYRKRKETARSMIMGLAGAGVMLYMMALAVSDDDEAGRNKVETDDMAIWTRNLRLPMSVFGFDSDNVLQIPWGFGLGAFAAEGAQLMAFALGNQSGKDFVFNSASIALDSYIPVPVSRINPLDEPMAFLADTITPSMARPVIEFAMNKDGLGRPVYNDQVNKYGDAFTGGTNVPEVFHSAAKLLTEITNGEVQMQPSAMYFFANNYSDGITRLLHSMYGAGLALTGQKDFDAKQDLGVLSSYIGRKSSIDAREYASVEAQVQKMRQTVNMFVATKNIKQLDRYLERHPNAVEVIMYYNKTTNNQLKKVRQYKNDVRGMRGLTAKERKEYLDTLTDAENLIKRNLISAYKYWGVEPSS